MPQQPGPVPTLISVLRRAAALMIDELLDRLAAAGFTGLTPAHQAVFENLDPAGDRPTELAARAGMTHQSMSELISVLEQRGYLERGPDPSDRRARIVRLTPVGRQMARRALEELAAIEAEWRTRLAHDGHDGHDGDIIDALIRALAAYQPGTTTMAGTGESDPARSI